MKRAILSILILLAGISALITGTLGALEETVKATGATFNISSDVSSGGGGTGAGNKSLKVLQNLSGSTADANLADQVPAGTFNNLTIGWKDKVLVKLYNKGAKSMDLISKVDYVSDPDTLRDDINATVAEWNDTNNNGQLDAGEEGAVYGSNTLMRWRNDTFVLGKIDPAKVKGLVLKFDGTGLSTANQGKSAVFDFVFTGTEQP